MGWEGAIGIFLLFLGFIFFIIAIWWGGGGLTGTQNGCNTSVVLNNGNLCGSQWSWGQMIMIFIGVIFIIIGIVLLAMGSWSTPEPTKEVVAAAPPPPVCTPAPPMCAQPPIYAQPPMYAQPPVYAQPPMYAQPPIYAGHGQGLYAHPAVHGSTVIEPPTYDTHVTPVVHQAQDQHVFQKLPPTVEAQPRPVAVQQVAQPRPMMMQQPVQARPIAMQGGGRQTAYY